MISRELPMPSVVAALEGGGRLADPGTGHLDARHRGQPGLRQFVDPGLERHGADVHARRQGVETMLTVKARVSRTLRPVSFWPPVGRYSTPSARIAGSAERQLKKLNGAALTTPCASIGRHQRDRPRHHGADQELVALARRQRREVEGHDTASCPRGSRSGLGTRQVSPSPQGVRARARRGCRVRRAGQQARVTTALQMMVHQAGGARGVACAQRFDELAVLETAHSEECGRP